MTATIKPYRLLSRSRFAAVPGFIGSEALWAPVLGHEYDTRDEGEAVAAELRAKHPTAEFLVGPSK